MIDKERIVDVVAEVMVVTPAYTAVLYRSTMPITKDEALTQIDVFINDLSARRVDMVNAGKMRQEHPSELAVRHFGASWNHGENYKGPRIRSFEEN